MCLHAPDVFVQPISDSNPYQRKQLATVALINTGSLWQYTCADDPAPVLVARVTGRGVDCSISSSTQLHQPQAQPLDGGGSGYYDTEPGQCPCLDAGATRPLGFWSGGVSGGCQVDGCSAQWGSRDWADTPDHRMVCRCFSVGEPPGTAAASCV